MFVCKICGFQAKNAAGLAGHRKMKHGVSPGGGTGVKKTKVLLIRMPRRLYNRIVNEADKMGMLPKELIRNVLRLGLGLDMPSGTKERKLLDDKTKKEFVESELVTLRRFVDSKIPFSDMRSRMHMSDYRVGKGLLMLLRENQSQENK